jgi:hypothetical protein
MSLRLALKGSAAFALTAALLAAAPVHAQTRIQCESRDYRYQFCPIAPALGAFLVQQRSRAACVQNQSWGWDQRGVWVDRGCEGVFDVQVGQVTAPGRGFVLTCESRNYQYEFCTVAENIAYAQLVNQRSRTACVEGRTWGWRSNGIWVNGGCEGDFQYSTSGYFPPVAPVAPIPAPQGGLIACESRDYQYTFCPTGPLRVAELVNQLSQSPCQYGQTWGYQNQGIWVDRGCSAEFAVRR